MHHDGIGIAEKPLEALEEVAAGQRLEALHRLAAYGLGLGGEERKDRRRRRLVGKPLEEREARLAQRHVGIDREPRDVVGLEVRRRGDGLQQLVALDVVACQPRARSFPSSASGPGALRLVGHMAINVTPV